jgi:NAD(P)-dependent dehydrogenase (short-subunit alcohol dehydrogenase family)
MSLLHKNIWVVGGVGAIGKAITESFLRAGATVIVNSREESRLRRLSADLHHPPNLVTVKGSLLNQDVANRTVERVLADGVPLHHVVAHGAVRYWKSTPIGTGPTSKNHNNSGEKSGMNANHESNLHHNSSSSKSYDETFSLDRRRLLHMTDEEFRNASSQLASLHFTAAKTLLPRLEGLSDIMNADTSYTFVTGDGGGHPSHTRSGAGEINSHHVWGLSAALRNELKDSKVVCREVRVKVPVNRPEEERVKEPRARPLSCDIGDLCAGLVSSGCEKMDGELMEIDSEATLKRYLQEFRYDLRDSGSDTIHENV